MRKERQDERKGKIRIRKQRIRIKKGGQEQKWGIRIRKKEKHAQ